MSDEEVEFLYTQQYLQQQNKDLVKQVKKLNELLENKTKQLDSEKEERKFQIFLSPKIDNKTKESLKKREDQYVEMLKDKQNISNEVENIAGEKSRWKKVNNELQSEIKAYQLTFQQMEQNMMEIKKENDQYTSKLIKSNDEIAQLKKELKSKDDQYKNEMNSVKNQIKTLQDQLNQATKQLTDKDAKLKSIEQKTATMQQQTQDLIQELIEHKNNILGNSTYGKDLQPEIAKMNEENEKNKQKLKQLEIEYNRIVSELKDAKDKEQKALTRYQELEKDLNSLLQQYENTQFSNNQKLRDVKELETQNQALKVQIEKMNKEIKNQKGNIDTRQLALLKEMEQLKIKNKDQEVQLIELQKLCEDLMQLTSNKPAPQPKNTHENQIEQLQAELKNLQSFIYDSPIEIMFTLLEDRLMKQNQKAPKNNNGQIKAYWKEQLKGWTEGFQELVTAFNNLQINFTFKFNN